MTAASDFHSLAIAALIAHEAAVATASFTAAVATLSAAPLAVALLAATVAAEIDEITRTTVAPLPALARDVLARSVRIRRVDLTADRRLAP